MKPTDFAYSLTSYLSKYLPGEVGASSNTIQSYRDTFSLLIKYCASEKSILTEKLTLHQLDRKLIEDLLNWLEEEENVVSQREIRGLRLYMPFSSTYSWSNRMRCINTSRSLQYR